MIVKKKNSKYFHIKFWQDGKNRVMSTHCEKRSEAMALHDKLRAEYQDRRKHELIARLMGVKPKIAKPLRLKDAWTRYAELNPNCSKDSGRIVFERFYEAMGDMDIADVTVDMAVDYLSKFLSHKGKTYNTYKSALSKMWTILKPYTEIQKNVWLEISNRPNNSEHYRPLTEDESKLVLKKTKGFWHDATIIAWYTGLRRKDIMCLKWEYVQDGYIELIPHKTKSNDKSVYVPLHKNVLKVLSALPKTDPYVFPTESKKLKNGKFAVEFTGILTTLGIVDTKQGNAGFHSLRSSFITRAEEFGISEKVIMGIVGHGSPAMTRHYSHDKQSAKTILSLP